MRKSFPHYQQLDEMDCGSTSLRMIAKYYGKEYSAEMLRQHCHITRMVCRCWASARLLSIWAFVRLG